MIITGKAAEYAALQKLAAFTKLPKGEFIRESMYSLDTREELPVYTYPILSDRFRCTDPIFYSVSLGGGVSAFNLGQLLDPDKWMKSEFREAFNNGFMYLTQSNQQDRFVLTLQLLGSVWAMRCGRSPYVTPAQGRFKGAILIQDPDIPYIFIMQPMKNYLTELIGGVDEG